MTPLTFATDFCMHNYGHGAGVSPKHLIALMREHREELHVWHVFLDSYNDRSVWMGGPVSNLIWNFTPMQQGHLVLGPMLGDGSVQRAGWRIGAGLGSSGTCSCCNLFPVIVALEIWRDTFWDWKIWLHCDNLGVDQVINQVTASSAPVVRLLHYLMLRCLQ